jgi:hypothetical protein
MRAIIEELETELDEKAKVVGELKTLLLCEVVENGYHAL